ncbi:hypothetical protein G6038_09850 [Rhodococcus sp. 14C212]|nr:hypothetical protein [Rhodococcus sp. 14C212]NGP05776.1 hypothetical protein [Rhodococcus sp. 14C212]
MGVFPTAGHLASWAGTAPAPTSPPAGSSPPRPDPECRHGRRGHRRSSAVALRQCLRLEGCRAHA